MSTSTPSDKPGSTASDFPPDPLLASGSFISPTTTTTAGDKTLDIAAKRRPIQGGIGVSGSGESVRIGMENSTDQMHPSPVNSAEPKSRKRVAPGDNWLPPGWRVEDKVRTSGATAGTVDKYYYEPVTGRKFRSRTEIMYYLEHGTAKRGGGKKDLFEGQGSSKASRKAKEQPPQPPLNFDFENPPEKVSWSMPSPGPGEKAWSPFTGEDKVEDSVARDWSTAFTVVLAQNPTKLR